MLLALFHFDHLLISNQQRPRPRVCPISNQSFVTGGLYKIRDCVYFLCSAVSTSSSSFCLLTGTFRACAFLKDIKIVWHNWHNTQQQQQADKAGEEGEGEEKAAINLPLLLFVLFGFLRTHICQKKRQVIYLTGTATTTASTMKNDIIGINNFS